MSPAVTDRRCPWGARTAVMAILNLTPDSFSDGGQHLGMQRACRAAQRMAAQGAVEVLQRGRVVDAARVRGPFRVRGSMR